MAVKTILVICASALFIQSAYSAVVGGLAPYGFTGTAYGCNGLAAPAFAYEGFAAPGCGCGYAGVASTGGGLPCASASPIPPVGVSVVSENVYEGTLAAGGNMPFLGTIGFEGVLPTTGAGAVSYGCGNSLCAVGAEEGAIATGIAPHAPYGPYAVGPTPYNGFDGIGVGYGVNGYGINGCGANGFAINGCGVNGFGIDGYGINGYGGLGLAGFGAVY